MRKPQNKVAKRQGGISLIPDLWDAIDRAAKLAGVPRNQVMEQVLMREFGLACDSQKTSAKSRATHVEIG
jgi:hypothetical protein